MININVPFGTPVLPEVYKIIATGEMFSFRNISFIINGELHKNEHSLSIES